MSSRLIPEAKPVIVFKIATVPDVAGIRLLHRLPATLADNEVVEFIYQKRRAQADISNAPDVLSLPLHRVVSIACAVSDDQHFRVLSLARGDDDEAALIRRFADLVAQEKAEPVSWNGSEFDLTVLRYRGLIHGVSAASFFDVAAPVTSLARTFASSLGTGASLHELATLCGFPRLTCLSDSRIWQAWRTGAWDDIHSRCEMDVVICHLVFLRFQLLSGALTAEQYVDEVKQVRSALDAQPWREFLAGWVI